MHKKYQKRIIREQQAQNWHKNNVDLNENVCDLFKYFMCRQKFNLI